MKINHYQQFFLANRQIGAWQNAWALTGDYLSAAAFMGSIALYFSLGIDSLFYAVATLIGWPLLLILFADKLRETGAYTLSGVLNKRFHSRRLQLLSSCTSILICLFYLLVQLMGAGTLLKTLLGLSYVSSLILVSFLTLLLVFMGGMKATTLVQSIKAFCLFLFSGTMFFFVWRHFDYSLPNLWQKVGEISQNSAFKPSQYLNKGIEQTSLILGLVLGLLGLPHILMRFFTVKNEETAVCSAAYTTFLIALFFTLNLIIGFGAYVVFFGKILDGGSNMVLLHLATLLGGSLFTWILAFIVLITILAVMAGLVIAASANLSQDLLPLLSSSLKGNLWIAKGGIMLLLGVSSYLAYLFEGVNLAFLFGIAFAWAASAHFPLLFCQFFMKRFNECAAFFSLLWGALASTVFIITSDTVWVNLFQFDTALHPYRSPTLFVLPVSFLVIWLLKNKKYRLSNNY